MKTSYRCQLKLLGLAGLLLLPAGAGAQQMGTGQGAPYLLQVQPPGAQAGTDVEVTLVGLRLESVQALSFSKAGIKAELLQRVDVPAPPPKGKKKGMPKGPPPTGLRFKVHVPAGTAPGIHEVRVRTADGISNPRAFVVGDQKEYLEKEPNNDVPQAQRVELNAVVHGAIANPTDVDYFRFAGRKGQRVLIHCQASDIDSKLEPDVELYDPAGSLLSAGRLYRSGEAVCDAWLPTDGDYDVRVCSFGYVVGGPDYFYRLSITTSPWIDAVFPPVVAPGARASVTVYGRNLPGGRPEPAMQVDGRPLEKATVTVQAPSGPALQRLDYSGRVEPFASMLDGFELRLRNEAGVSNPFLLTFARAPVVLDRGGNDTPATAQTVSVPCEVAGWIEKKGDRDWYAFEAEKGQTLSLELFGERLGSPVDLQLSVRRADKDQKLAELDDTNEVLLPQVLTRTDDPPRFRFTAPAAGRYLVGVVSTESYVQAGPRHLYRLHIGPEQPDFRLLAFGPLPNALDTCTVPAGGHQLYTVLLWRLDGFAGAVELSAAGLPEGVHCQPQTVPPGGKVGYLVLTADEGAEAWTGTIAIRGKAVIQGEETIRQARAAGAVWPVPQPNLPAVCRLERNLALAVRGPAAFSLAAGGKGLEGLPGKKLPIALRLKRNWPEAKTRPVQVTALALPPAFTFQQPLNLPPGKDQADAVLTIKPNAEPGTYTVLFRGQAQLTGDPKSKKKGNQLVLLPSTPVTVTVLPRELAKLTVSPAKVKVGGRTEVLVKLKRLYNFEGPFQVRLVLPPQVKGIEEVQEVTIGAGANEARLVIQADPEAAPGPRPGLVVRAVARFQDRVDTTHEAKLNLTVVK